MTDIERQLLEATGYKEEDTQPQASLESKFNALMEYMGLTGTWNGNVFEVVKAEMPTGDYTNPILFVPPMNVTQGKWYYTEEIGKDLPREAIADANKVMDFNDTLIFDWV